MLGFQLFEMWGKYILYCKSHQLCKAYPFSDVTAISVQKEILQIFFADNYDATILLFSDVRAMKSIPVHPDKMQIELA